MKYNKLTALAFVIVCGCAPNPGGSRFPPDVRADPSRYSGDPALYELLGRTPRDSAGLDAYEINAGSIFMDRVGEVAEDSLAPLASRVEALNLIGARKGFMQLPSVRIALHARDPRVRATALNTADALRNAGATGAPALLREALDDPTVEIQVKALQFVGDGDISLLREFVRGPHSQAAINAATDMLRAAEERGAPLVADSAGGLGRMNHTGHSVRFTPTTAWPAWNAAAGRATIRTRDGKTIELSDIEAVNGVVPIFFSPDGMHMVYESARTIHVRTLATGVDRVVGPGIAPRLRPFSAEFVYMLEDTAGRASLRERMKLRYEVVLAPFVAGASETGAIGALGAFAQQDKFGNYAPVRWMRVEERKGLFFLAADGMEAFQLPSPFVNSP